MKASFANVRPACDFQGVLSDAASICVVDGRMEAYNKFLTVSQPCDLPDFAVAATDFDFALRKVTEPVMSITETNVILKGGGTTRVKRMAESKGLKKPDIKTAPMTNRVDMLGAIDDVFPFTEGDPARPWSEGARFDDLTVTATNSVVLCQATLSHASGLQGVTVSRAGLSYIRQRRADLKAWGVSDRGILLEFEDGGWALISRMSMEMPDAATGMVNQINDWGNLSTVSDDYRKAILSASEWADGTDDTTTIYEDRVHASRLSSEHDEPAQTTLGDPDVPAVFAAKALAAVMSVADQIAFDRFPLPVPFKTKRGSSGLLAGRTS